MSDVHTLHEWALAIAWLIMILGAQIGFILWGRKDREAQMQMRAFWVAAALFGIALGFIIGNALR